MVVVNPIVSCKPLNDREILIFFNTYDVKSFLKKTVAAFWVVLFPPDSPLIGHYILRFTSTTSQQQRRLVWSVYRHDLTSPSDVQKEMSLLRYMIV